MAKEKEVKEVKVAKESNIKRIRVRQFLTGSYGVFNKEEVIQVPEQLELTIAEKLVSDHIATIEE